MDELRKKVARRAAIFEGPSVTAANSDGARTGSGVVLDAYDRLTAAAVSEAKREALRRHGER